MGSGMNAAMAGMMDYRSCRSPTNGLLDSVEHDVGLMVLYSEKDYSNPWSEDNLIQTHSGSPPKKWPCGDRDLPLKVPRTLYSRRTCTNPQIQYQAESVYTRDVAQLHDNMIGCHNLVWESIRWHGLILSPSICLGTLHSLYLQGDSAEGEHKKHVTLPGFRAIDDH